MFKHIYLNRLKCLLRDKVVIFWSLIFPIILGTFFNFAFSNLKETIDPVNVGIIQNDKYEENIYFKSLIESLNEEGDNKILNVSYLNEEDAKTKLKDNVIEGIIKVEDTINLSISEKGLSQTVLKNIIDSYLKSSKTIETLLKEKPNEVNEQLINELSNQTNYLKDITSNNKDLTVIYFYTLIGMTIMYAGFWGIRAVTEQQANLSSKGMRLSISPVSKFKSLIPSLLAGLSIHLVEIGVLLLYLILILNKDFGSNLPYVILLCITGSITGLLFGTLIGSVGNLKEERKVNIVSMGTLILSFLSGMMYVNMKYIIEQNIPILNRINPVALITDALYALYYYDTYNRFFENIMYLTLVSLVFMFFSYILLRRRKYESL